MKKKSNDELGTLITREMKAMLQDDRLTKEQRFDILASIMFDIEVYDILLKSFADSLKTGFDTINANRLKTIEAYRQSKREYASRNRNLSISIEQDRTKLPSIPTISKQNKAENIPLNPPSGVEEESPRAISPDDLLSKPVENEPEERALALELAEKIEKTEAYSHMMVNRSKLIKCLISVFRKKSGALEGAANVSAKILTSIADWTADWKSHDWQYAPGKITDFLYDDKWLQEPRNKKSAAVAPGCGECGVEIV